MVVLVLEEKTNELYETGCDYFYGRKGVKKDYTVAFDYLFKVAHLGHPAAMNLLGYMYENKFVISQPPRDNLHEAYAWYILSANHEIQTDSKTVVARYNVARMIAATPNINGKSSEDVEFALKLMISVSGKLTDKDYYFASCKYILGVILLTYYKDYSNAFDAFFLAAVGGSKTNNNIPEAWHNLGFIAENGKSPDRKFNGITGAIGFYEKAALLGRVESMDSLGRLYAIRKQYREAMKWTQMAADKGYGPSITRLKGLKLLKWFG